MPPKTTSTRSSRDELLAAAAATASSVAPSSRMQLQVPAEQAALGVEVADDHPGDVGVGEPDERERAGLLCDHSHLDRALAVLQVASAMTPPSVAPLAARMAGSRTS